MADPQTLLLSAFSGGSTSSRHGDFVMVKFPATTFAASAMDFHLVRTWARGRLSLGNPQRDRVAFIERFETLLARGGSGIATKGNRPALRQLVSGLTQVGIAIGEWSVPHNIDESMEVKRRAPNTTPAD